MSNNLSLTEDCLLSLEGPIKSSTLTRWERKAQQAEKSGCGDRFIPNREQSSFDNNENSVNCCDGDEATDYQKLLKHNVLCKSDGAKARVLAFKDKAPAPVDGYQNPMKVLYSQSVGKKSDVAKPTRHIPSAPVRVLDAPDLVDDYYLNLMSWGSNNVLAVALSQYVYLWDAASGGIKELMSVDSDPDDYITSVAFIQQGGTHIGIGTASNTVQLWDVQAGKRVRTMNGHSARVGALSWNNHILSSGSKDTTIIHHDVRVQNHCIEVLKQHSQEICGLAWSPDGNYIASGANDNSLCIFEGMSRTAKHVSNEHQAAVKALAWCPHERNLLASGGGTADRTIKFWNASSGALLNSIDTGSQVCALQWSPFEKELLSSHGYAENQLCLWKYPTMVRTKELKGHTARALHMVTSPDGSLVASAAADETIRFWNVFASEGKKKNEVNPTSGGLSRSSSLYIR